MPCRIGVDIGGSFTDLTVEEGESEWARQDMRDGDVFLMNPSG